MSNRRVLVTGANGYIGTHVIKELLARGCEVVACDFEFDNLPQSITKLSVDIFNSDFDVYNMAGRPDNLIHLAWRNGFKHNAETHITDWPLHVNFLMRMIDSGVKDISVMGSMHEVGYWEGAITEDTPTNPMSLYGVAKNALRQVMEIIVKNTEVNFKWLRGYYIYGDDRKSNSVLGKILEAEERGQKKFPFTSGKNLYDYISVDDLARQIVAASLQNEYHGIINCCSGKPISLGEMAENFIKMHNLKIELQYGVFPDRVYDSPGVWGDADKINKIVGAEKKQPKISRSNK